MRITPTVHGRGMSSISPQHGFQFNSLDEVPPGLGSPRLARSRVRGEISFPSPSCKHTARRPGKAGLPDAAGRGGEGPAGRPFTTCVSLLYPRSQ